MNVRNVEWLKTLGEWEYGIAELSDGRWLAFWTNDATDPAHLPIDGPGDVPGANIHPDRESAAADVAEMVAAMEEV